MTKKHEIAKMLKMNLKRKVKITNSVVVAFLIAGFVGISGVLRAEEVAPVKKAAITSFKDIPTQKTSAGKMNWGSDNIEDMMKNLENLNKAVNGFGFKKSGLLMSQIAIEKILKTDLYATNKKLQAAVLVMISKNNEKFEKLYGEDYANSEKFKKDMEFVKSLPDVSHNAMSDLTMYLPKVMDKADEVLAQVNTNTEAIDEKVSTSEFNEYKNSSTKALESYVKADASNIDEAAWKKKLGVTSAPVLPKGVLSGRGNEVNGDSSVIVAGVNNNIVGHNSAILNGFMNKIKGGMLSAVLMGGSNELEGTVTTIVNGKGNKVYADNSFIVGSKNKIGKGAGRYGMTVKDSNVFVLGDENTIKTEAEFSNNDSQIYVLGKQNSVTLNNNESRGKVYILGSNVTADNINNAVVLGDASTAVSDAISVGSADKQRNIKFVKDGEIAGNSKDAVNAGQLYSIAKASSTDIDADAWKKKLGLGETSAASTVSPDGYFHVNTGESTQEAGNAETNLGSLASKAGAQGYNSMTAGVESKAYGSFSTAVGYQNTAYGNFSSVFGAKNTMDRYTSQATGIGIGNVIKGNNSTLVGFENKTMGEGTDLATAMNGTAVGYQNKISATGATAVGYQNVASGEYSVAMGASGEEWINTASGEHSSAIGNSNTASGSYASAFGTQNAATEAQSSAFGKDNEATAMYASAMGFSNYATAMGASAFGASNKVYGKLAFASGYGNEVGVENEEFGEHSVAVGYKNIVKGNANASFGLENTIDKTATNNFILGSNVNIGENITGAVVLGDASTAVEDAISVGSAEKQRNIKFVKDGEVAENSTDAVNAGQLYSVVKATSTDIDAAAWKTKLGINDLATTASLEGYAKVDASNANVENWQSKLKIGTGTINGQSDGETVTGDTVKRYIDGKGFLTEAPEIDLGGAVAKNNAKAVTGGTVYNYLHAEKLALGSNSTATGKHALAIGVDSKATGRYSSAIGTPGREVLNAATGDYSSAFGNQNSASAMYSSAFGTGNTASGMYSSAFGSKNNVEGSRSLAFGHANKVYAEDGSAFGHNNTVGQYGNKEIAKFSSAFGYKNTVKGLESLALGNNITIGENIQGSVVLGHNSTVSENNVVSVGSSQQQRKIVFVGAGDVSENSTDAINGSQLYKVIKGISTEIDTAKWKEILGVTSNSTSSSGSSLDTAGEIKDKVVFKEAFARMENANTIFTRLEDYFFVEKDGKEVKYSMLEDTEKEALKDGVYIKLKHNFKDFEALALGKDAKAYNHGVTAIGEDAKAFGEMGTAIGVQTFAQGQNSTAIGKEAHAEAYDSMAIGSEAYARGDNSMAIGVKAKAEAWDSMAIGKEAKATKTFATALGWKAKAEGIESIAMGYRAKATKEASIAIGKGAYANETNGLAIGKQSQVKEGATNSIALGMNSWAEAANVFSLGKGTMGARDEVVRRIVHVGAGNIAANSTDAINGSQLYKIAKATSTEIDTDAWKKKLGLEAGSVSPQLNVDNYYSKKEIDDKLKEINSSEGTQLMDYIAVANEKDEKEKNEFVITGKASGAFGKAKKFVTRSIGEVHVAGDHSYMIGNDNQIAGNNNFILGNNVVIDTDAKGKKITDSVALGNNSEVKESNVVSVGSEKNKRKIVNVAAGVKDSDAATVGQLKSVTGNTARLQKDIRDTRDEMRGASALTAALAGLHPMDYREGQKTQVQAAVGSYRDKQAVAVGASHHLNENVMLTAGLSLAEGHHTEAAMNLGLSWRLGESLDRREVKVDNKEVQRMHQRMQKQEDYIQKLEERLNALENRMK